MAARGVAAIKRLFLRAWRWLRKLFGGKPSKPKNNPYLIRPTYVRLSKRERGFKAYKPAFKALDGELVTCKHFFRRATSALNHARAVHGRWMRMYIAAVMAARGVKGRTILRPYGLHR
jgi:hypothetical protein